MVVDYSALNVKTLTGKTLSFDDCNPLTTVRELKSKISEKEGVDSEQMRLVFAGRQLEEDDATLEQHGKCRQTCKAHHFGSCMLMCYKLGSVANVP